jgi:hypothetical protein
LQQAVLDGGKHAGSQHTGEQCDGWQPDASPRNKRRPNPVLMLQSNIAPRQPNFNGFGCGSAMSHRLGQAGDPRRPAQRSAGAPLRSPARNASTDTRLDSAFGCAIIKW